MKTLLNISPQRVCSLSLHWPKQICFSHHWAHVKEQRGVQVNCGPDSVDHKFVKMIVTNYMYGKRDYLGFCMFQLIY